MLDANPIPRASGLHGVSVRYLPGLSAEPTLARAITVPDGYKRVLDSKAKLQIRTLLAMPDRPVSAREMAETLGTTRDGASSVLAQLGGKNLVIGIRDTTAPGAPAMFRLTPAGKREQAAQRAGA
jgi:hypothetical protein